MSDIPEIRGEDYTPAGLMAGLMTGEIPVPVWIRIGRTRHRITPENRESVQRGLLIAIELQTQDQ